MVIDKQVKSFAELKVLKGNTEETFIFKSVV